VSKGREPWERKETRVGEALAVAVDGRCKHAPSAKPLLQSLTSATPSGTAAAHVKSFPSVDRKRALQLFPGRFVYVKVR